MSTVVVQVFLTIVPCLIVGFIAYKFFENYLKDQARHRQYLLKRESAGAIIPYRIQALERLTLLMERINPQQLLLRVKPENEDIAQYVQILVGIIEQEYEHNVAQQIYVSDQSWSAIKTSKNAIINLIRSTANQEGVNSANQLREQIFLSLEKQESPSVVGIQFLKKEAAELG